MAGVFLFSIPKTGEVTYHAESRAVISHWESLCTPDCCKLIERGIKECGRLAAKSWVVDLTRNPGVPSQEDYTWMGTIGVDMCHKAGVVAVINVHGDSAIASMGAKRWSKNAVAGGLTSYDCKSMADALQLAADIAAGRAA
jgi:hypothetical protein